MSSNRREARSPVTRNRTPWTIDQLTTTIDHAHKVLAAIRQHGRTAIHRDNTGSPEPDGYPTGSTSNGRAPGPADPTLTAAIRRLDPPDNCAHCRPGIRCDYHTDLADELHTCRLHAEHQLDQALDHLNRAMGLYERAATLGHDERGRRTTIVECLNCGDDCLPRPRAGRCWPCYEYRRRHGGIDRIPPLGTRVGDARAARAARH